jgi:hypothetical protein
VRAIGREKLSCILVGRDVNHTGNPQGNMFTADYSRFVDSVTHVMRKLVLIM